MPIAKPTLTRRNSSCPADRPRLRRWNLVPVVLLGFGAGCHLLPVHRIDPSIDPRRVGQPAPAQTTDLQAKSATLPIADRTVPLPPLPLLAMSDSEVLEKPAPTPLLDAALKRADEMESSLIADPAVEQASHVAILLPADEDASHKIAPDLLAEPEPPLPLPEKPVAVAAAEPRPTSRAKPRREPETPTPPIEPPPSADPWGDGIAKLQEFAAKQSTGEGEPAEDWRLRRRILDWLAQDRDRTDRRDDSWDSVLSILAAASPEDGPVDLKSAARAIEAKAPLEITDLQLCQSVEGFGVIEPLEAAELKPKQKVVLYCELSGVESEQSEGIFHSQLETSIALHAAGSETPVWKQTLGRAEDACRRKRLDYYVAYPFSLPETIKSGNYVLKVHQHDVVADRDVAASMDLTVKAAP